MSMNEKYPLSVYASFKYPKEASTHVAYASHDFGQVNQYMTYEPSDDTFPHFSIDVLKYHDAFSKTYRDNETGRRGIPPRSFGFSTADVGRATRNDIRQMSIGRQRPDLVRTPTFQYGYQTTST